MFGIKMFEILDRLIKGGKTKKIEINYVIVET